MSKIVNVFLYLLLVIVFVISCTKDVSQETGQLPGIPNSSSVSCKSCNFYPWCQESSYTYIDSTSFGKDTLNYYYQFLYDTTINGVIYTSTLLNFQDTVFHNCDNYITTLLIPSAPHFLENHTILKSALSTGATWENTFPANQVINNIQYKILTKSTTRKVAATNFIDVMSVQENAFFDTSLITSSTVYYARGVGEIERITKSKTAESLARKYITSYNIP